MLRRVFAVSAIVVSIVASSHASGQELSERLRRIFASSDFSPKSFGPARWTKGGSTFTTLETSAASASASDIVEHDTASGRATVLVSAAQLTPAGGSPLMVNDYLWSDDSSQLLVFTAAKRVWRYPTSGDYWVLNRKSGKLRKLGGDAPASSLLFAKFSPDASQVAYVRAHNLYVEDVSRAVSAR